MYDKVEYLNNCQQQFSKYAIHTMFFLLICISSISVCSCRSIESNSSQKGKVLPKSTVSVDELQNQINEFKELFSSRIKSAASEIDTLSVDPKIMKMTLLWRSRAIPALHNILEQQQPMVTFVDCWLLCKRLTNYIEAGEAGNIFGDFKSVALTASKEIEAKIENIARIVLSEELFNQTNDDLRNLALANPIQSGFSKLLMYSEQAKKSQPGLLESVFKIPLSPVRALEGVDRTPAAIYDFSTTTRRLTDVVQEMPESTRWQLLLLLYDLEETNMAKSFLSSLENIAQNSAKLSAAAEQLPTLLEDSDKSQEKIQNTLGQVNETVSRIRELLNDVQQTATVFSKTAHDVNKVAISWAEAARATDNAIRQLKLQTGQENIETADRPDLKETANSVREAANEIKLLSETLPNQTQQLVAHLNLLTTRITVNIAILIVLIFCLSVAYCIIRKKTGFTKT